MVALAVWAGCGYGPAPDAAIISTPDLDLRPDNIRAHVAFLADDLLEGRGPGARGGDLAALYVATQYRLLGLEPLNGDSYYQMVPLVGIKADPDMQLKVSSPAGDLRLAYSRDFMAWAGVEEPRVSWDNRELVFVGYGISAPEVSWDDYKDRDVRGKVVLVLVNEPPSEDPEFFGGRALTYYGRWTYKLEEAARRGAAGAIIVHNTDLAGYPWSVVQGSWAGENFTLPQEDAKSTIIEAWVHQDRADEVLKRAGLSFDQAVEAAARRDFEPVPLNQTVSLEIRSSLRRIHSPNVLGLLRGNHPSRQEEVIVVTSHYDHLGLGRAVDGDSIYNGALDNASGVGGMLEMARALGRVRDRLGRSVIFAAVTAEEQGLLGSEYYARNPPVPLARTAANVNVDSINVWGRTEDIVAMGAERTTIQEVVEEVAREMEMILAPDPFAEKGFFFRSDQFSFVKMGVPAVYLNKGTRFVGKPEGWGEALVNDYIARHYHQPSDRHDPSWSFEGAGQMMEFALRTVLHLSIREQMPQWRPGDPFGEVRKRSLEEAGAGGAP